MNLHNHDFSFSLHFTPQLIHSLCKQGCRWLVHSPLPLGFINIYLWCSMHSCQGRSFLFFTCPLSGRFLLLVFILKRALVALCHCLCALQGLIHSASAWHIFMTRPFFPLQSLFTWSFYCLFPGGYRWEVEEVLVSYGLPT